MVFSNVIPAWVTSVTLPRPRLNLFSFQYLEELSILEALALSYPRERISSAIPACTCAEALSHLLVTYPGNLSPRRRNFYDA